MIGSSGSTIRPPHRKKPAGAGLVSQIFVSETLTKNFAMNGLPRGLLFVIDNRRTGAMLVAMSADILYSTEVRHALRFVFTLTLGIWR